MRTTNLLRAGKRFTHNLSYLVVSDDIPKVVGRQHDTRVLRTQLTYRHLERAENERLTVGLTRGAARGCATGSLDTQTQSQLDRQTW